MQEEDYIQSVMANLREIKKKRKEAEEAIKYDTLRPNTSKLSTPYMQECHKKEQLATKDLRDITKDTIHVDRDQVRAELKHRIRMAWKDPGFSNNPFGPTLPLRNNVLSEWERDRCIMPERSYTYVQGKGNFRMDHFSREFKAPTTDQLGENYKVFLNKFEKDFMEYVLMPSKFGVIKEQERLNQINRDSQKAIYSTINTVQNKEFGFPETKKKRRPFS